MPIPPAVQTRMQTARQISQRHRGIVDKDYMQYHPVFRDVIEAVLCKDCSEKIRGMAEDDRFEERSIINGQTVIYRRLILTTLSNYAEITINFDDNSHHVTSICRNCSQNLTVNDLEAIYMSDLRAMNEVEKRGGGSVRWEIYGARRPTGFVKN